MSEWLNSFSVNKGIAPQDIHIVNIQGNIGASAHFDKAQVSVTISGLQDDLNKLNASELAASIDASRLSEGTHQVELSLKLDEDHYAYQPITVSVTVKAKNTQDGDTSTDSGEDTGE